MLQAKDWTLLAISFAGREISPVQLQKSLFLLGQELPNAVEPGFYHFGAYNYGPFSGPVYRDAEALADEGLVAISNPPGQRWREYSVTLEGRDRAKSLESSGPANGVAYLRDVVAWTRELSFQELVRAIYKASPHMRENSVFQG